MKWTRVNNFETSVSLQVSRNVPSFFLIPPISSSYSLGYSEIHVMINSKLNYEINKNNANYSCLIILTVCGKGYLSFLASMTNSLD